MLSDTMQEALNNQVTMEFASEHVYLSMSAYFERESLPGFAHWMRLQAGEEHTHAMKLYDFINDRDGKVVLQALPKPPSDFSQPVEAFEKAYEHEQKVTASINRLYGLAVKEGDYPSLVMLEWFVNEQVEEEKSAKQIVDQLKRIGNDGGATLMLDREMAARAAEPAGGEEGEGK
jgi:ferritin